MAASAVDVKALGKNLWTQYRKAATKQTDITDLFLVYVLATGFFQVRIRRGEGAMHAPVDVHANHQRLAYRRLHSAVGEQLWLSLKYYRPILWHIQIERLLDVDD